MSCTRTEILCPNCFKKKLMEDTNDNTLWCDECGTHFVRSGGNSVKYK